MNFVKYDQNLTNRPLKPSVRRYAVCALKSKNPLTLLGIHCFHFVQHFLQSIGTTFVTIFFTR